MKPFDLEAALNGAPVVTRDGAKVYELRRSDYLSWLYNEPMLFGFFEDGVVIEFGSWPESGMFLEGTQSENDLLMAEDE